jgi:acyl-CoA synthetase (AMP-forming)/AMP-acid ligase II
MMFATQRGGDAFGMEATRVTATSNGWIYADIFDQLATVVARDQPALVHGSMVTTWRDFDRRTNNFARALIAGGANPGEKIAFYLRNHPAYLEGLVAAFKARQTHVNVNYRYVADEVRYIFDNADATTVIFAREFSPIVEKIAEHLPLVRRWLVVEDGSDVDVEPPRFAAPFEPLADQGEGRPIGNERSPDDLFFLYTGGTTGMPKGVMWRQDALRRALINPALVARVPANLEEHLDIVKENGQGPINLPACPLMHGTGLFTALSALVAGGAVVTTPSPHFDAHEMWAAVDAHGVNQIIIVGDAFAKPMLRALDEGSGKYDVSRVLSIVSSGVMWSREVKRGLLNHMPQVVLADSFGSSEAVGFGLSLMTADGEVETAKFKIGDNVKVFTPEGREILPGAGEVGLIARGDPIPEGYYKDQAKTDATFKTFGGIRYSIPGDFCTVEEDGTITLLGRGSGCINTAGEKVFPEEVEEVLKLHPDIEDALVVGAPDEKWGQSVTGVVELRAGADFDEADLRNHVRLRLAGYKTPKRLFAVSKMFRAPNGKADYKGAREWALRELGIDAESR